MLNTPKETRRHKIIRMAAWLAEEAIELRDAAQRLVEQPMSAELSVERVLAEYFDCLGCLLFITRDIGFNCLPDMEVAAVVDRWQESQRLRGRQTIEMQPLLAAIFSITSTGSYLPPTPTRKED